MAFIILAVDAGEEITVTFNSAFNADALQTLNCLPGDRRKGPDHVSLALRSPVSAAVVSDPLQPGALTTLLMPIRA